MSSRTATRKTRPTFTASAVRDLLTVGDSESPIAARTADFPLFRDIIAKMFAGSASWADLLCDDAPVTLPQSVYNSSHIARPDPTTVADFKAAFAAFPLKESIADIYDTSNLSDDQFRTVMEWLSQKGWNICEYERTWVSAYPAQNYSTNWVDVRGLLAEHAHHDGCCSTNGNGTKKVVALSAPGTDQGRRVAAPVPRFCKDAHACQKRGCAYVHGNTIPRLNEPCRFGAECGASDPTGVKRSQCLRMHPGEHYHPEMVVTRV